MSNTTQPTKWSVTIPPTATPVSRMDAEDHLRLDGTTSDGLDNFIAAATDYAEDRLSAALTPRTIRATFYDGEDLIFPRGPLIEVQSITDRDQTATTDYEIKHIGNTAQVLLTRPIQYPITITYQAGYASATAIPASIRVAILMHVATLWENRESITDKPKSIVPHALEDFYRLQRRSVGVG